MVIMLTRGQVARRIGRSVATVRRLEGSKLHPVVGPNGVRLFDPKEVDVVAREVATTGRVLDGDSPFEGALGDDEEGDRENDAAAQLRELEGQLLVERRGALQLRREIDSLRGEQREWRRAVDGACAALVSALDDDDLDDDVIDAVDDLVDALDDD